jgi:signal transduction histidine kinase
MHVDLVQAQTHKDEFVAAVGHELRTPMSAILGLNAVLREQLAHQPEQVEAVDHIRRSARQLLSVVNNILDFSQLQAGQLHLRPDWMDVRQVLTEVQDECRNRASFKGLDVRLSSDPSVPELVHLDRQRFKQLVANLLDNALRYSPDGGVIAVTAVCHAQRLRVDVSDTGAGIDPAEQAHIFEVFPSGSERRENAAQGTGLGLSICQQLVALHGGRIGVVSDEGAGARF